MLLTLALQINQALVLFFYHFCTCFFLKIAINILWTCICYMYEDYKAQKYIFQKIIIFWTIKKLTFVGPIFRLFPSTQMLRTSPPFIWQHIISILNVSDKISTGFCWIGQQQQPGGGNCCHCCIRHLPPRASGSLQSTMSSFWSELKVVLRKNSCSYNSIYVTR